jgi:pyruvate dehydrogenase E2 component (dihydrolipoyllysine-residue acetyltransferase)
MAVMVHEFRFPDVGEGITEGELLAWKVKEGDTVSEDQTLAEMETDKAVVELPSPSAGRVARLHADEGDIVQVGDVLVTFEESAAAELAPEPVAEPVAEAAAEPVAEPVAEAAAEPEPYTGSVVGQLEEAPEEEPEAAVTAPTPSASPLGAEVLAMPSVRALAKELGVDLTAIRGTGPGGRIIKQDVEDVAEAAAYGAPGLPTAVAPSTKAASGRAASPEPSAVPERHVAAPPSAAAEPSAAVGPSAVPSAEPLALVPALGGTVEADSFGLIERVAFRGVRRTMAKHMAESVAKQAQVTTVDEADVTIIKRIREKERTVAAERGVRLTYLAFVIKACTASLKRFPRLNAVLEESKEAFVLKRYYNVGIAVDTKYGLVVPNIKDADRKSIFRIAEEIVDLVDRAGERRLDLSDLQGGTFTITNYGAIGGTFATPVINYPEVAILGMGRVRELPIVREGKVTTRLTLPLSLTFDHQLIDGAEAVRFLNLVMGYLEDPDLLLLEGA